MPHYRSLNRAVVKLLRQGKIGVLPTDTIYGLVASAMKPASVERVYRVRKRDPRKPMIVLISSMNDLRKFGIRPAAATRKILGAVWPGPVSVILPCRGLKYAYLHRDTSSLAFRLPTPPSLRKFLKQSGPLVAPSANPESKPPAETVAAAKRYFGANADFYVDVGRRTGKPSELIKIVGASKKILRS